MAVSLDDLDFDLHEPQELIRALENKYERRIELGRDQRGAAVLVTQIVARPRPKPEPVAKPEPGVRSAPQEAVKKT